MPFNPQLFQRPQKRPGFSEVLKTSLGTALGNMIVDVPKALLMKNLEEGGYFRGAVRDADTRQAENRLRDIGVSQAKADVINKVANTKYVGENARLTGQQADNYSNESQARQLGETAGAMANMQNAGTARFRAENELGEWQGRLAVDLMGKMNQVRKEEIEMERRQRQRPADPGPRVIQGALKQYDKALEAAGKHGWDKIETKIRKEYPNATNEQIYNIAEKESIRYGADAATLQAGAALMLAAGQVVTAYERYPKHDVMVYRGKDAKGKDVYARSSQLWKESIDDTGNRTDARPGSAGTGPELTPEPAAMTPQSKNDVYDPYRTSQEQSVTRNPAFVVPQDAEIAELNRQLKTLEVEKKKTDAEKEPQRKDQLDLQTKLLKAKLAKVRKEAEDARALGNALKSTGIIQ